MSYQRTKRISEQGETSRSSGFYHQEWWLTRAVSGCRRVVKRREVVVCVTEKVDRRDERVDAAAELNVRKRLPIQPRMMTDGLEFWVSERSEMYGGGCVYASRRWSDARHSEVELCMTKRRTRSKLGFEKCCRTCSLIGIMLYFELFPESPTTAALRKQFKPVNKW